MSKNPLLDSMADVAKRAYIRERIKWNLDCEKNAPQHYTPAAKWDSSTDAKGRTKDSAWTLIAKFALKHGLDPERCIALRFALQKKVGKTDQPPMPNMIALEKYVEMYTNKAIGSVITAEEAKKQRISESSSCINSILFWRSVCSCSNIEAVRAALRDKELQVSVLTRYCLAVSEKHDDIAAELKESALTQYAIAPDAYDEAWGEWLPTAFKAEARALRTEVTGEK